ncbi:hypothetical protein KAR50_00175 [Periweissella fabaria]|uniref:DUF3168 domain-containing protein n=1 Tax=Periweissella fabaria TaxID=546157 RepID=A0ABM8Z9F3_9LACO|nr:hypothetical protein [Periweissella fabaria]MCM0596277.1 hypothetical protein [Periweissella fabaria]CAH0417471.1 hypothetical protein WFA24289_01812 [Periweissella fabaria]
MKFSELGAALVNETKLPVAYHHFNSEPEFPYIVYLFVDNDGFEADNSTIYSEKNINIELYTEKKDLVSEQLIESFLNAHEIPFYAHEEYIDEEHMYMNVYEITLGE